VTRAEIAAARLAAWPDILPDSHVEGFIAAETALERVRAHGLYAQAVERATWAGYRDIYRRVMADITAAVPS
jgi:hypothetical protein